MLVNVGIVSGVKAVVTSTEYFYSVNLVMRAVFAADYGKLMPTHSDILKNYFNEETESLLEFLICSTCRQSLNAGKLPTSSKMNGFVYPKKPDNLPALDPISERLISPRIPFMHIRRLRYQGSYEIVGQVINVPVDVPQIVKHLPRHLRNDYAFNVNIKRNIIHKSVYLRGHVQKSLLRQWLLYLTNTTLYKQYEIKVYMQLLDNFEEYHRYSPQDADDPINIEPINVHVTPESEILAARQHTMLWNEEHCLDIAPGQNAKPMNIIYDQHARNYRFLQFIMESRVNSMKPFPLHLI